jgi:hypothetical protein
MKKFTRQNKVLAGKAMQLLINYCQETDQKSKQRKRTEITPVLLIDEQKIPQNFERYSQFFAEFQNFLSIYSTISRGTPKDVLRRINVPPNPGWNALFRHCIYLRFQQIVVMMPKIIFKFRAKEIECRMTK